MSDQLGGSIGPRATKNHDEPQRPAPSAIADKAVDSLRFELIEETCDLVASYMRSAAEAAFRGDRLTLGVHLKQGRLAFITGLKTYNELSPESGEKAGRT